MVMVMYESVPKVLVLVGAVIALPLSVHEVNQRIDFTFLATSQRILCILLHLHAKPQLCMTYGHVADSSMCNTERPLQFA